jgi:hypothetical protein
VTDRPEKAGGQARIAEDGETAFCLAVVAVLLWRGPLVGIWLLQRIGMLGLWLMRVVLYGRRMWLWLPALLLCAGVLLAFRRW